MNLAGGEQTPHSDLEVGLPNAELLACEDSVTMKLAALIVLTICFAGPAAADGVTTLGTGANATCGKWLADRQSGSAFDMYNWALGYLSGAATFSQTLNPLEGLDSDAVLYWIDNYCRSHVLDKLTVALKAFAEDHPR
jgi:hypothetical protein